MRDETNKEGEMDEKMVEWLFPGSYATEPDEQRTRAANEMQKDNEVS